MASRIGQRKDIVHVVAEVRVQNQRNHVGNLP